MSTPEAVIVEGTECVLFPIPKSTQDNPLDDAQWFGECFYHRLYALNQKDQQRSRELSLAITNLQQAMHWFDAHRKIWEFGSEFGVERDDHGYQVISEKVLRELGVDPKGGES